MVGFGSHHRNYDTYSFQLTRMKPSPPDHAILAVESPECVKMYEQQSTWESRVVSPSTILIASFVADVTIDSIRKNKMGKSTPIQWPHFNHTYCKTCLETQQINIMMAQFFPFLSWDFACCIHSQGITTFWKVLQTSPYYTYMLV